MPRPPARSVGAREFGRRPWRRKVRYSTRSPTVQARAPVVCARKGKSRVRRAPPGRVAAMAAHEIGETTVEGRAVRVLRSPAGLEAAFAPEVGMIGCSLRHQGEELLGQRGGLAKYADTGSSMGIPLLHPWANRLDGLEYEAEGVAVRIDPNRSPVRLDPNGLPIHGLVTASRYWQVTGADADADAATLSARLPFADHPELLAGFPFAHELLVEVRLAGAVLALRTTLRPTGDVAVPVAFGYHPYLRLPGKPREAWEATLPVRSHAALDDRGIPTGAAEELSVPPGPLGGRVYDDLYPRLRDGPG